MGKKEEIIERYELDSERKNWVVKDNRAIQEVVKRKFELSAREQKVLGYILSKIKQPINDIVQEPSYTLQFEIRQFCKICGISCDSGANYKQIEEALDGLADNAFWLYKPESRFRFQWIHSPEIKYGGTIEVEIPKKTMPYLYDMAEKFTEYRLYHILVLKSGYSIALYEWFKSYAFQKYVTVDLSDLKNYLGITEGKYEEYKAFRRGILERCIKEIEEHTDLRVKFRPIRQGRCYKRIEFEISEVDAKTAAEIERKAMAELNGINYMPGQLTIYDY